MQLLIRKNSIYLEIVTEWRTKIALNVVITSSVTNPFTSSYTCMYCVNTL